MLDPANTGPIQQGDLFITAGVAALTAPSSSYTPIQGEPARARLLEAGPHGALDAVGTRTLVMVVSHDCQLDKEFNRALARIMKAEPDLDELEARDRADRDLTLDRNVVVAPVVGLDQLSVATDPNLAGTIRAGRVIGYLPIPAQPPHMPEFAVADLGVRVTVDRLVLTDRIASLTDPGRLALRYGLAKMDAIRTPDLGAELEAAVGRRVVKVERPDAKVQTIRLTLDDNSTLEFLPRPSSRSDDLAPSRVTRP